MRLTVLLTRTHTGLETSWVAWEVVALVGALAGDLETDEQVQLIP
jgi:hypothetical protein